MQNGLTHAFIVEFDSEDDRNYYIANDPSHQAFKESIGSVVENATVLDFTDGLF
jgi:hypothetical protein